MMNISLSHLQLPRLFPSINSTHLQSNSLVVSELFKSKKNRPLPSDSGKPDQSCPTFFSNMPLTQSIKHLRKHNLQSTFNCNVLIGNNHTQWFTHAFQELLKQPYKGCHAFFQYKPCYKDYRSLVMIHSTKQSQTQMVFIGFACCIECRNFSKAFVILYTQCIFPKQIKEWV